VAGFADIVRAGVAVADSLTSTLQKEVLHQSFSEATKDGYLKVTWVGGTFRKALIESVNQQARASQGGRDDGTVVYATTKLTLIRPVFVDPRDRFTLPDGRIGLIVSVNGLVDPDTGRLYLVEVFLG